MFIYFVLYMFIYKTLVKDMLCSDENIDKSIAVVMIPMFLILTPLLIVMDILALPIYIVTGIIYIIFELLEKN